MIYERLRQMVVAGQVPTGVRITESELAATLTTSRTPVREALSRLEADGLVRARGRGVQVIVLGPAQLGDVLEARAELEACTARRLAERVNDGLVAPVQLRELRALATETGRLTNSGDIKRAVWSNRAFHLQIAQLAGNAVIQQSLQRWWDQIVVATRAGLHTTTRASEVADEHEQIVHAIEAADPAGASAAARQHVMHTKAHLSQQAR